MVSNKASGAARSALLQWWQSQAHGRPESRCPGSTVRHAVADRAGRDFTKMGIGKSKGQITIKILLSWTTGNTVLWRQLWRISAELAGLQKRLPDNSHGHDESVFVSGSVKCEGYDQEHRCRERIPKQPSPALLSPVTGLPNKGFLSEPNKI